MSAAAGGALDASNGDGGTDVDTARSRPSEANGNSTADMLLADGGMGMGRPGDGC